MKTIINIIIIYFINKKKITNTKKKICVPAVNTIGDALIYYDYLKYKIKKPLVISTKTFPSDKLLPFYFSETDYIFFENKLFYFIKNMNLYNKRNSDHIALQILEKKFNTFKYYLPYEEAKDKMKKIFKTDEYKKLRKFDNKFKSLLEHYNLKKRGKPNINNFIGYSKNIENNTLKYFKLKKEKYVCIHIRPYPKDKKYKFKNKYETNPRSVKNINNYNLTINYLIKKNFKVVLMGNSESNLKLNNKNKNIIHYYKHSMQNIINDIYLVNNCYFFIGTQSGPGVIASILNKASVHTNYISFFGIFPSKYSLYLPKKFVHKKKILDLKKYFNSNFFFYENSKDFNYNNISVLDNSKYEIFRTVKELMKNIKLKKIKKTKKQLKFIKSLGRHNLLSYYTKILISDYYLQRYLK